MQHRDGMKFKNDGVPEVATDHRIRGHIYVARIRQVLLGGKRKAASGGATGRDCTNDILRGGFDCEVSVGGCMLTPIHLSKLWQRFGYCDGWTAKGLHRHMYVCALRARRSLDFSKV